MLAGDVKRDATIMSSMQCHHNGPSTLVDASRDDGRCASVAYQAPPRHCFLAVWDAVHVVLLRVLASCPSSFVQALECVCGVVLRMSVLMILICTELAALSCQHVPFSLAVPSPINFTRARTFRGIARVGGGPHKQLRFLGMA